LSIKPGPPPQISLIIAGNDEQSVQRYVEGVYKLVQDRLAQAGQPAPPFLAHRYEGRAYGQFGPLFYAVADARLLVTNHEADLRTMLDRLSGKEAPALTGLAAIPAFDAVGTGAAAMVAVDLQAVRQLPDVTRTLQLPSENPPMIVLVGGWMDLLRRSEYAIAGLKFDERDWELRFHFPAGRQNVTPGLTGFFAAEPGTHAAPLLQPADVFYSASWFRDYAALWNARSQLVNADVVKKLEQANTDMATTTGAPGFAQIVQMLGPHFRVVACRQTELGYDVSLNEKLPTAAILVDLREEAAFRAKVLPNLQTFAAIISIGNKLFSKKSSHAGADLYSLHFPADPKASRTGNRLRYNFEPTYTITRGHFILGSTAAIVRGTIAELDRLARETPGSAEDGSQITERQQLSLAKLVGPLQDFQEALVRQAVLEQGLTVDEAQQELNIVTRVLEIVDQLQVTARFGEREFEYHLRLGPAAP
jgi:hypothetical protein